jgi:hypothetical protein
VVAPTASKASTPANTMNLVIDYPQIQRALTSHHEMADQPGTVTGVTSIVGA